ncbi:FISUMP domain-containing protein [uncultured Fibrobacter sp.]|uniref:FISUMP domain-containing protein n=1 Tax=uncultured Fibrobacter sp. TaxID=261512 RepID=UPI00157118C0|nr:FISUMP domain-containing protein [uncultured Fibrobacter sp.]
MRKAIALFSIACMFIACGDDASSSPAPETSSSKEISSSEEIIESSSSIPSSSSIRSSSSAKSSSSVASSNSKPYVEKHLAWDYLNPALSYGEFTDERDGHVYKYVDANYGRLRFMAENLNYSDSVANPNLLGNSWCPFNSLDSCSKYGRLYTWAAAMNVDPKYNYEHYPDKTDNTYDVQYQGLCPDGWLMYANMGIWNIFWYEFGPEAYCAQDGWMYPGCTNELGFTALPNGYYEDGEFKEVGENFYYWSVQGGGEDIGGFGSLLERNNTYGVSFRRIIDTMIKKTRGAAVRCYQLAPQDPCIDPVSIVCHSSNETTEEN